MRGRTVLVLRVVHQRDDPPIILARGVLARHEERLHGELGVTRAPLDFRRAAKRGGAWEGDLIRLTRKCQSRNVYEGLERV